MKIIAPITMTDAQLTATDVSEDDTYSAWSGATGYVEGNTVYLASTHRRYEAVTGSTGEDPSTDDGTYWIDAGATTRWRPFDGVLSNIATRATSLYYTITPTSFCNGLAVFGISGGSVRVRQDDAGYDETISLVETTEIVDWLSYVYWTPAYSTELLLTGIPGAAGSDIRIDVDATGGTAAVGEIVLGRVTRLGDAVAPTTIGIVDYSTVERGIDGAATIVERAYTSEANYTFTVLRQDEGRVKRALAARRAAPTVFFTDFDDAYKGTLVYGLIKNWSIPISGDSESFATLEVEGVS